VLQARLSSNRAALGKTKKSQTRPLVVATRADIDAAIEALSAADEKRLEKAARYRVKGLGRRAGTRSYRDLLHDALVSIFVGAENPDDGRHWPMSEVSFIKFVDRTMESIASHWAEAYEHEPVLESETLVETDDGGLLSPLDATPTGAPSQEREAIANEELGEVLRIFEGDNEAALIIEAWGLGMKGPEIMEQFGLSEERYEAGRKRIRYKVRA